MSRKKMTEDFSEQMDFIEQEQERKSRADKWKRKKQKKKNRRID